MKNPLFALYLNREWIWKKADFAI